MGICGSTNQQPPVARQEVSRQPPQNHSSERRANQLGGYRYAEVPHVNQKDLPLYEQVCPNHPDHGLLEQDVLPLLRVDNDLNLNKRYTYLYKVDPNKKVGKDIKMTYGYDSRVSLEELKKKRQEFWGR